MTAQLGTVKPPAKCRGGEINFRIDGVELDGVLGAGSTDAVDGTLHVRGGDPWRSYSHPVALASLYWNPQTRAAALDWCSVRRWEDNFPEDNAALTLTRARTWLSEHAQAATSDLDEEESTRLHNWSNDWQSAYRFLRYLATFATVDEVASLLGDDSETRSDATSMRAYSHCGPKIRVVQ